MSLHLVLFFLASPVRMLDRDEVEEISMLDSHSLSAYCTADCRGRTWEDVESVGYVIC